MSTVAMRRLEIVALKRDANEVLECLGHSRCFQIVAPGAGQGPSAPGAAAEAGFRSGPSSPEPEESRYRRDLESLEELRRSLGLSYPELVPEGTKLPEIGDEEALLSTLSRVRELDEAARRNAEKAAKVREQLEEARVFQGLELPYGELDKLAFMTVRIGRVESEELPAIRDALGERAIIVAPGGQGDLVVVASRKSRFAVDSELSRAGFSPRQLPPDFEGSSPDLVEALESSLAALEEERLFIEGERRDLREEIEPGWAALAASFAVASSVEEARDKLDYSSQACRIEGWAPVDKVEALSEALYWHCSGRVALRSFEPKELESVRSGAEEVPVLLKRRGWVSSFERMVLSFGTPPYGSVDPTPFVCAFFVLFFTIMFGDLGQGALILLGSIAIYRGLWMRTWKVFAPIGMACGIGSMIMGTLTGSCFTFESLLVPFTRWLSSSLFGAPVDRFLTIMPEAGSNRILYFFGFTLALGVIVNSMGLVINIIDRVRGGEVGEALFSKTGLAGALFFWWALGMGVRVLAGAQLGWYDALGLGLPLAALMFEDALRDLVDGRAGSAPGDGVFASIVKGFVAVLESLSYFLSGTLSFLRVGAFALSHVVLSFITFSMGDMVRTAPFLGPVWQGLVVLFGNAIIVFLEGLIVAIQVVRLQYYEFLSKFLTQTGLPFVPFKFQFRKEQP